MNRRDFLKKTAFVFTGAMFVPKLGIWRPKAEAFWGHQTVTPGTYDYVPDDYASWDEATEADMASDGAFVWVAAEDGGVQGPEYCLGGGFTGDDLILSARGEGPGYNAGPPPYRIMDTNKAFTYTAAVATAFFARKTWSIMMRLNFSAQPGEATLFQAQGFSSEFSVKTDAAHRLKVLCNGDTGASAVDLPAATTVFYYYAEANGKDDVKYAYHPTKPTTWSAMQPDKTATIVGQKGNCAGEVASMGNLNCYNNNYNNAAYQWPGNLYWVILAKVPLIPA